MCPFGAVPTRLEDLAKLLPTASKANIQKSKTFISSRLQAEVEKRQTLSLNPPFPCLPFHIDPTALGKNHVVPSHFILNGSLILFFIEGSTLLAANQSTVVTRVPYNHEILARSSQSLWSDHKIPRSKSTK